MSRYVLMIALVAAGELVFGLPFHTARFFRPTLLEVFSFSNTQLGDVFAVYGVTAMLSYFPGGILADRFSARSLIALSLFATAAGGLYMATIPGTTGMAILYGYWGVTSISLLWAALIRATREWGGDRSQGLAFGVLDGGRGLVAVIVALIAVEILALYLPENVNLATPDQRENGFRNVILMYSLVTCLAGLLIWFTVPVVTLTQETGQRATSRISLVLRRPVIWAHAAIIVCAYCGYKGLDNYSLYAAEVLGKDEVEAARLAANAAWLRPVAALLAGLIADRVGVSRSIGALFLLLFVAFSMWSMAEPAGFGVNVIYANFFFTSFAVFALRGIYFALLEENCTPKSLTGTAVGIVSLAGFAPEVFFAPIAGRILDADPGLAGHQNYLAFLASIALAGVLVVVWSLWLRRPGAAALWPKSGVEAK